MSARPCGGTSCGNRAFTGVSKLRLGHRVGLAQYDSVLVEVGNLDADREDSTGRRGGRGDASTPGGPQGRGSPRLSAGRGAAESLALPAPAGGEAIVSVVFGHQLVELPRQPRDQHYTLPNFLASLHSEVPTVDVWGLFCFQGRTGLAKGRATNSKVAEMPLIIIRYSFITSVFAPNAITL